MSRSTSLTLDNSFTTASTATTGPLFTALTITKTVGAEGFHAPAAGNTGYSPNNTMVCGISVTGGCCGYSYADATFNWSSSESVTNPQVNLSMANSGSQCIVKAALSSSAMCPTEGNPAATTSPKLKIYNDLSPNAAHAFYIQATDASGNTTVSPIWEFTMPNTAPMPPTGATIIPPQMYNTMSAVASANSVTITWTTDQSASSQVIYGATTSYGSTTSVFNLAGVISHSVTFAGLSPNTTYHYAVQSVNASGMVSTSQDATFTTTN